MASERAPPPPPSCAGRRPSPPDGDDQHGERAVPAESREAGGPRFVSLSRNGVQRESLMGQRSFPRHVRQWNGNGGCGGSDPGGKQTTPEATSSAPPYPVPYAVHTGNRVKRMHTTAKLLHFCCVLAAPDTLTWEAAHGRRHRRWRVSGKASSNAESRADSAKNRSRFPSNHWRALEVVKAAEARRLPEASDLREAYQGLRALEI